MGRLTKIIVNGVYSEYDSYLQKIGITQDFLFPSVSFELNKMVKCACTNAINDFSEYNK